MTLILKSIEEEAQDCREACAALKVGDWAWLVHHEKLFEPLTDPLENRIRYIIENKTDNVALRLRLLRPFIEDDAMRNDAEYSKARAEYSKARAEYYKMYAEWDKVRAESYKAEYAEWNKAGAELIKMYAKLNKAYAEYSKALETHYKRLFPDSPWNGKTIFAGEFKL